MRKKYIVVAGLLILCSTIVFAAITVKVGAPFPVLSLKSYVPSKTPTTQLVVFMTTWSKSSQAELEALKKVYGRYQKKGLRIVGVSFDEKEATIDSFVADNKIPFTILHDKKLSSPSRYQILVIPTTFLVSADGKIKKIYSDFDSNVLRSIEDALKEEFKSRKP